MSKKKDKTKALNIMLSQEMDREFFKTEYVKRHLAAHDNEFILKTDGFLGDLIERELLSPDHISCLFEFNRLLLEYYRMVRGVEPAGYYDMAVLNQNDIDMVAEFYNISIKYGYYAHHLRIWSDSHEVLRLAKKECRYVDSEEYKLALNPIPLRFPVKGNDLGEQSLHTIYKEINEEDVFKSDEQLLLNENSADIAFLVNINARNFDIPLVMDSIERRLTTAYASRVLNGDFSELSKDVTSRFINLHKRMPRKTQYRPTHYNKRVIGIWLWDYKYVHGCDRQEAIKAFRASEFSSMAPKYKESGDTYLGGALTKAGESIEGCDLY